MEGRCEKTAARAKAIVLIAGASEGLAWEVQQLKKWGALAKTIFIIPPLPEEDTNARIARLVEDLELPESVCNNIGEMPSSTLTGLRVSHDGKPIFHTANGRDWANYFGTVVCFLRELDGSMVPPAPGELSKLNGYG